MRSDSGNALFIYYLKTKGVSCWVTRTQSFVNFSIFAGVVVIHEVIHLEDEVVSLYSYIILVKLRVRSSCSD